jgi:hypothetical protein
LDLAPCEFDWPPEVKSKLKGTHFQSADVKPKMANLLNRASADGLQQCFEQWKIHMGKGDMLK